MPETIQVFRLFLMPCCYHMLCWVNPRFPNYCPECGTHVYPKIKDPAHQEYMMEECILLSREEFTKGEETALPCPTHAEEMRKKLRERWTNET